MFIGGWLVTLIAVSNWSIEVGQAAMIMIIVPNQLETIRGEHIGQLAALHEAELSEWSWEPETSYVRFGTIDAAIGHESILTYTIPVGVDLAAISQIRLLTNWRGPVASEQQWWWEVRNGQTGQWHKLGDNSAGQVWRWTAWSLEIPLTPAAIIDGERRIFIRYQANNNHNESALDQLVVELTLNSIPPNTATPVPTSPSGVVTPVPTIPPTRTNVYIPCITNETVTGTPPPSTDPCAFRPNDGVVFATSLERDNWYQLANRGNSGSVLAPYLPNRVYQSYPNNVRRVEIASAPHGRFVQEFQNLAGTHEPQTAFKFALPRSDVYYWRLYRQYEPGYQFTCESKAFSIYAHNPITYTLPAGERPNGINEVSCFLQMMPNCWYDNRAMTRRCFDAEGINTRSEPVLYCYHLDQPTGYGEKFRQNIGEPIYISSGQWIDFQMMMKLNKPGQADGEIKLWINGTLKMHHTGIRFRTVPELQLNAASLGGYIGGTCTSVRDQKIWDDHYMVATTFITDERFAAMCETKTEWFDTGISYDWDLDRRCWPGVSCLP